METSKILSADLLDLLFEGRNKEYGAYDLRKTYRKRIMYAMTATFIICLLLTVGSIIANGTDQKNTQIFVKDLELEKAPDEKKAEPPPIQKVEPQPVATAMVTPPLIVPDDQVTPDDIVKDVTTLDDIKIGAADVKGVVDDAIAPPVEKAIGMQTELKPDEDYEGIFRTVQYVAEFPGGVQGWTKYLERYLNSNIPVDNGAPQGKYTVIVSFTVNKTGDISDVMAENDPGYGTKGEAIRVIQKGPKWKPAMQNGRNVIYRQKQSISFIVSEN